MDVERTQSRRRMGHLEEVRRIVLDALRGHDVTVRLYGSWARGRASVISDIDVAVEPHAPLPRGILAVLRDSLEESRVPYRVEVVDPSDADPEFKRRVKEEGIVWNG